MPESGRRRGARAPRAPCGLRGLGEDLTVDHVHGLALGRDGRFERRLDSGGQLDEVGLHPDGADHPLGLVLAHGARGVRSFDRKVAGELGEEARVDVPITEPSPSTRKSSSVSSDARSDGTSAIAVASHSRWRARPETPVSTQRKARGSWMLSSEARAT